VFAVPWAVAQKFGNDQAGGKAALMAYYGLFALFPLLWLLTTILGFALSGNPALRDQPVDPALGQIPVIGTDLRSQVHPLEGNGCAWPSASSAPWDTVRRTLGVIGLLGLAAVSSTALAAFATTVVRGLTATLLAVAGSSLVNLGLFLLAFMVLTAEPLRVREVAVGAVTATVFWEALQLAGTWFVTRGCGPPAPPTASSSWSSPCCPGCTSAHS
jgi:uncharacterized BrkB/YihY/UPF0761 family membrane protein